MNVVKVIPRGFCLGVVKSIKMTKDAIKMYPDKKIYMIGLLVHNKIIVEELEQMGVIVLDDFKKNRIDLLNNVEKNSVVIFSAHGTDEKVIKKAEELNLTIVDTKCEWVLITEVLIKKKLEEGYEVIFIGKHGHPETIALTSIDTNKVHLVTNLEEVKKLNISHKKLFITNQTTLSLIDTQSIYESLKEKYPNIEFKNDLCDATLERQEAILKLKPEEIDLLFIVGDQRSNNTLKLVELGNSIGIRSIRINQKEDILDEWLVDVNTVAVSAGASTSSIVQNQVIKFLEEKNRI